MRDFPHVRCAVFAVSAATPGRDDLPVAEPAAEAHLSSAIAAALDEICEDLERYHVRQEQRLQLARCIAAADELIEELEGLSLAGSTTVPPGWQARLDRFVEGLPAGVAGRLRCGFEPNRLLDQVFAIEERLFRLKLGEWAQRYDSFSPDADPPRGANTSLGPDDVDAVRRSRVR
jgi:hypothetical protein